MMRVVLLSLGHGFSAQLARVIDNGKWRCERKWGQFLQSQVNT